MDKWKSMRRRQGSVDQLDKPGVSVHRVPRQSGFGGAWEKWILLPGLYGLAGKCWANHFSEPQFPHLYNLKTSAALLCQILDFYGLCSL